MGKEERELVYYTPEDIEKAKFTLLDNKKSAKPWSFQVQLTFSGDVEFAPGEFAATSEENRKDWVAEFKKVQKRFKLEKSKSEATLDGTERAASAPSAEKTNKARNGSPPSSDEKAATRRSSKSEEQ